MPLESPISKIGFRYGVTVQRFSEIAIRQQNKMAAKPKGTWRPGTSPVLRWAEALDWAGPNVIQDHGSSHTLSTQIFWTPRFCASKSGIVFYPAGGENLSERCRHILMRGFANGWALVVHSRERKRKTPPPPFEAVAFVPALVRLRTSFENASADVLYPGARLGGRSATSGSHGDGQWLAVRR